MLAQAVFSARDVTPLPLSCEGGSGSLARRPTASLTGKFLRLMAPGLGFCETTRPTSDRRERTRRTLPTEQCARRIFVLRLPEAQSEARVGHGSGSEEAAEVEVVAAAEVAEAEAAEVAEVAEAAAVEAAAEAVEAEAAAEVAEVAAAGWRAGRT